MASAFTIFIPQTFSLAISSKLMKDNFLAWMQLAKSTIKGYHLKQHITGGHAIPSKFLTKEDEAKGFVNLAYENFKQ